MRILYRLYRDNYINIVYIGCSETVCGRFASQYAVGALPEFLDRKQQSKNRKLVCK